MPPAVLVGALAAGGVATGVAAIGGAAITLSTFLTPFATSLVLGGLSAALAPKPKSADFTAQARDRTHVIRSSIAPRRIIYGETIASGPLVGAAATGASKEFLHLVIPVAGHEVDLISDVYFNDLISTNARFAGNQRVKAALGTDTQVADSDLVAEVAGWTTDHRLRGIAYVYVRLTWNADVWPTGIPNIKALIRGRKVYDPRDAGTRWSNNPALIIRDYLTASFGLRATAAEIDDTSFIAAANACDEAVAITATADAFTADAASDTLTRTTLNSRWQRGDTMRVSTTGTLPAGLVVATDYYLIPVIAPGVNPGTFKLATTYANAQAGTAIDITTAGSGTHTATRTAQARYTCDGAFDRDMKPLDIADHLVATCAGALIWQQGKYRLYAGAATAFSTDLGVSDLRGPIQVRPKAPRRDLANAIKGTYVEPWAAWQPTDYPPVLNAAYETQDGGERIEREMHFSFCQDQTRAQRLAKIALETARQGITVEFPAKLTALKVAVWDVVRLTIPALGWSNKEFRVTSWQLAEDGGVDLRLQEYAGAVYTWAAGEATLRDPAPDTNLPNPFTVAPPSGLLVAENLFVSRPGDGVKARVNLTWQAPADAFVREYQAEYKLVTPGPGGRWTLQPAIQPGVFHVAGQTLATQLEIFDLPPGAYEFRVKAVNSLGVSSLYSLVAASISGLAAPPAAPQNLTIASIGGLAILRWTPTLDLDVAIGGRWLIRHSPALAGATWVTSTSVGEAVAGAASQAVLPLREGTYLVKAEDSGASESVSAASVTTAQATVLAFANTATINEHPSFAGSHDNTFADAGVLQLGGVTLVDAWADFDAIANVDFEGGIAASGTYAFAGGHDAGTVVRRRLTAKISAVVENTLDQVDSRAGMIDDWDDFDGTAAAGADAYVEARATDDDPGGSPTWGPWMRADSVELRHRAFQFRARLARVDPAYNIRIDQLAVAIDQVM